MEKIKIGWWSAGVTSDIDFADIDSIHLDAVMARKLNIYQIAEDA